ncbi:MAG: hypothetical protein JXD19_04480 [Deltaproteobacteria bacterium]|nr:hypothetical protein [Deltaproteobacteria bacterium]
MHQFEYEITKYPTEAFHQLVFFCSETGECSVDQVPGDQTKNLENLLNQKGMEGWELIQVAFGKGGILAFWKRSLA